MASNNIVIAVNQDRYDEAKDFHAARDLFDLARRMAFRILRTEDKGAEREIGDDKPAERDQFFHCTLLLHATEWSRDQERQIRRRGSR
jgi:hypothetical protein